MRLPEVPEILDGGGADEKLLIAIALDCANAVPATRINPVTSVISVRCIKSPSENGEAATRFALPILRLST